MSASPESITATFCSDPAHQGLAQENERLREEIESLKQRLRDAEDKLAVTSDNSNKPPSSAGYEKPAPKSRRKKTNKKPGGQKGHKGHRLEMVENPDKIALHTVETCSKCGRDLSDVDAEKHDCRQEFDIPEVKPTVTEHRREYKLCPDCQLMNAGQFPAGITQQTQYGPRVKATAVYLSQYQFIPYDRLGEFFADCYQLPMSDGSLVNFNKTCGQLVAPSVEKIQAGLVGSAVVGFDESGMRVKGKLHWLHVARNEQLTYYAIHQKRGKEAIEAMGILPNYPGIATHDHWRPYYHYENCQHSLCNAHHLRELEFVKTQHEQQWADAMSQHLNEINDAVKARVKRNEDNLSEETCKAYSNTYDAILSSGLSEIEQLPALTQSKTGRKKQHKAKNLWDRLSNNKADVLRFMYDFRVPFTNNGSEGDIRMCKLKAKISGSFRSDSGATNFCTIRSYISTVKKQSVNVLSSLSDAFLGSPFIPTFSDTS